MYKRQQYFTSRGNWYHRSWKGEESKSGGIVTNIGVHFFDMLLWIFGDVEKNAVDQNEKTIASGFLKLKKAEVNWLLSIDQANLPQVVKAKGERTFRSLNIEGEAFEFSDGFTDLHTKSYQDILEGKGFGISDVEESIAIISNIRIKKD